jgi:hypothetical protein
MELVMVYWVDSHSASGWQSLDKLETMTRPLHCRSVGYLLSEKGETVVIGPHINGDEGIEEINQVCGDLAIPKCSIKKITRLVEKRRKEKK